MTKESTDLLNTQFAIDGALRFEESKGGLTSVKIANSVANAEIYLHGGQIVHYQKSGEEPVLWLSENSFFDSSKPIRGGIPICWPWFGPHPEDSEKPAHGFARLFEWTVASVDTSSLNETRIELSLETNSDTQALWPNDFKATVTYIIGKTLTIDLKIHNPGDVDLTYSAALHSYFNISDISAVILTGLEGCEYIDTLESGDPIKTQDGTIGFNSETDRIYINTDTDCVINDSGFNRKIRISKSGSLSTVVWNPWIDKSKRMSDFGDEEYESMLCVETCNARGDARTIGPKSTANLIATISTG